MGDGGWREMEGDGGSQSGWTSAIVSYDILTNRQTDRQMDKQRDRQTDR